MFTQVVITGIALALALNLTAAEIKIELNQSGGYKDGESPVTASGGVITGKLPVKLNGGVVEFPAPGTEGKIAFQSIDFLFDRLLKKNGADFAQCNKLKVSFELKALSEIKPAGKSAEIVGVNFYNYVRMGIRDDGTILIINPPKAIATDDAGKLINIKDLTKFEIYLDKTTKKCHLLVNNIAQGGELDFFNAEKAAPMLRLATNVDATAANYLQLAIQNISCDADAVVSANAKTAKNPGKTAPATKTPQPTTAKAESSVPMVNDLSKVNITPLSEGKAGEELLQINKLAAAGNKAPPKSWGTMAAGGKGKFTFTTNEEGKIQCKMDSSESASRMQFGIMGHPDISKFSGQIVTYEAWVRGENLAEGDGPVAVLVMTGEGGDGRNLDIAPKYQKNGRVAPTLGTFEWTKLTATFRLPERTKAVTMLNYLMNSKGILEWKNISLTYTPDAKTLTLSTPNSFLSAEDAKEKSRAAGQKHIDGRKAALIEHFGKIASGSDFYTPKATLSGKHPRMLPLGVSLDEIKKRSADPRYADYVKSIKSQADAFCEFAPDKPNMDVEDPMRGLGDAPMWMAMAYIIETDATAKAKYMQHLQRWINLLLTWGVPKQDLPVAHCQESFTLVYDWLYNELPAELKVKMRQRIIEQVRYALDLGYEGFYMWRYGQFLANHNWFVHNIMAMGALALWGDENAPLKPGEVKSWLDEAIQNYYYVENVHSADGYAIEGPLYQDYGLRPYFSLASLLDSLLNMKYDLLRSDSVKKISEARLSTLLPGTTGFMVYSDGNPEQYSGSPFWFLLGSTNNDPHAQTLAIETKKRLGEESIIAKALGPQKLKSAAWRTMFYYNPDVKPVELSTLPLFRNGDELGLYVTRSSWTDPKAAFLGIRCGDPVGKTARKFIGPTLSNGHCYPEQGNFSFYVGDDTIIPGMNYAREKLTTNHNLVVFRDERKPDRWLGQAGEGGSWFDVGEVRVYKLPKEAKKPEIYKKENTKDYSVYFADIGCFYFLPDDKKKLTINPDYKRMLLFLPGEKSVVIVDKITIAKPQDIKLRLLTGAKQLAANGREFALTMKSGGKYLVYDQSPQDYKRHNMAENVMSWTNTARQTIELTAEKSNSAIFAVVIGPEAEAKNIKVTASATDIEISGKQKLQFKW